MNIKPFWLIWNESARPPNVKHFSLREARDEAKRLARANPGQKFHILQSIETCEILDVMWTVHDKVETEDILF